MSLKSTQIAIWIIIIYLSVLYAGCSIKNQFSVINFAPLYSEQEKPLITGVRVFHESDSLSRIYVRYRPSSLKYEVKVGSNFNRADYTFSYKIFKNYESKIVLDSGAFRLYDSLYFQNQLSLVYNFSVKTPGLGNWVVELKFSDLNRAAESYYPVQINKSRNENAQDFLLVDENDEVIFEDWINWKTRFRIITTKTNIENLFVDYYDQVFPEASPPFSMAHAPVYQLTQKERFVIKVDNGITGYLQYGREGFFHFRSDTSAMNGFTLFRFHDDYPQMKDDMLLPGPMRYLTTDSEFYAIAGSGDYKAKLEKFWIEIAGNENRGLQLMSDYFSRVELANLYFSSYKEGWKTDRGLIYIIFGPPVQVYRRSGIETWIYGDPQKRSSLRFDFIANQNPFTFNDFELIRQPDFKSPYYIAVDFWRR